MTLEKTYHPESIEKKWYHTWETAGYFTPQGDNIPYCIMIPPPNVTGSLHMGHAFQDTLMDILIRYYRMMGRKTLWQVGTDHAGIATQMVVEKQLAKQNITRHQLGRTAFIDKIWQWKEESGGNISQQLRRLGASVDWSSERFTLDEGLSQTVQKVFIQLYQEGLIYRGKRLVNWDPELHTAVSDLEVNMQEEQGHIWHIRYPIQNSTDYLCVATTRPETLFGDVAVAVHPEDERYQHLIGQLLELPLTNRTIPIIADTTVEPTFGTGCVKITPAHDFNDYLIGERHHLNTINIFTQDAKLNDTVPPSYRGLDRFVARNKVIQDLTEQNLMEKIEPHVLKIPRGEKNNVILEPYLTDQWFVKVADLAKPAISAVESGAIRFIPEHWSKTYFEWMHNIQDWCISRQLWWGHRIPAWYDEQDHIYVGMDEASIRQHYQLDPTVTLRQDEDVLDTWFSSALWPFSTLGWPDATERLANFYPTQVLVTGFDIIFFWVARMIMFGLKFTGQVPFKEVYIHGLIQDHQGQKMSKTKGNVIDPIDLIDGIDLETLVKKRTYGLMQPNMATQIEKATRHQFPEGIPPYGTDALRFSFASLATTGRHIRFDTGRINGYRNFCNKLWNASRYVFMNVENQPITAPQSEQTLHLVDRWILALWQETKKTTMDHIQQYRFDLASKSLYEFIWNEYCDWYLEFSKTILNDPENPSLAMTTRHTLIHLLEEILRGLHPIMPYITEEIWQKVAEIIGKNSQTIMLESYPQPQKAEIDIDAVRKIEKLKNIILAIRNIRGEMNIAPKVLLTVWLFNKNDDTKDQWITQYSHLIQSLAKVHSIEWIQKKNHSEETAIAVVDELEILIPLKDMINKDAEKIRLEKELSKIEADIQLIESKFANAEYVSKAPEKIIQKDKERLLYLKNTKSAIEEKLSQGKQ